MDVTAVDWEQAQDAEIQEFMTKVRGWQTRGHEITRDFLELDRMAWAAWNRDHPSGRTGSPTPAPSTTT